MWDVFLRRWLDLLFWWAPRKEGTPRDAEPARRARASESAAGSTETGGRPTPAEPAERPAQAKGGAPEAPQATARAAAKPATKPPEKTVAPSVPDDLTQIKGIGPAMQNRLRALGITTFADLAAADPDQLMKQLKGSQPLSLGRVRHWTEAARERART